MPSPEETAVRARTELDPATGLPYAAAGKKKPGRTTWTDPGGTVHTVTGEDIGYTRGDKLGPKEKPAQPSPHYVTETGQTRGTLKQRPPKNAQEAMRQGWGPAPSTPESRELRQFLDWNKGAQTRPPQTLYPPGAAGKEALWLENELVMAGVPPEEARRRAMAQTTEQEYAPPGPGTITTPSGEMPVDWALNTAKEERLRRMADETGQPQWSPGGGPRTIGTFTAPSKPGYLAPSRMAPGVKPRGEDPYLQQQRLAQKTGGGEYYDKLRDYLKAAGYEGEGLEKAYDKRLTAAEEVQTAQRLSGLKDARAQMNKVRWELNQLAADEATYTTAQERNKQIADEAIDAMNEANRAREKGWEQAVADFRKKAEAHYKAAEEAKAQLDGVKEATSHYEAQQQELQQKIDSLSGLGAPGAAFEKQIGAVTELESALGAPGQQGFTQDDLIRAVQDAARAGNSAAVESILESMTQEKKNQFFEWRQKQGVAAK